MGIYTDGTCIDEVSLNVNDIPKQITCEVKGVKQFEIKFTFSYFTGVKGYFGLGAIMFEGENVIDIPPEPTTSPMPDKTYDADYTTDMRNFITNQGTNNTLKYLCSDSNFTNSVFVYRNDQKFGSMLTNFLTDAIYRGDEGWKDLFAGQTSVEEAEKMIAGLLDSYQLDGNALSKSKTAHKYASLLVKEFNEYIRMDAIRGMLNDAQFNQLQNALKEDDVAELLITQKYDDIIVTLLEKYDISFNADINQKLYGFMESQQLAQALSDGMKIMGKGLTVLAITKNTFDKYYELESVMNADENYCEMLKYLKENCKYSVVQEAAGNLYEATKNEMTDILDEVMKSLTTDVAGEVVDSILDKAAKASIYTNLIKGAIDLGVGYTNAVLNVGSVQELKDAMRTEAYIGNCLSGWVLKNQREFYSTLESTDISKQNEAGERLYYSLYMLWQTRAEGEKTLQSMLEKAGSNYYSKYYTISKEISYSLDSMKDSIFEKDRMNALLGITVACPVDVEICDSNGKVLVTVKDGQKSKGYVDGIYYNVSLQPFERDYVKYISLPENETYSIRCVGKNAGQVDCSITGITDNGTVVQKYFENVTVDKNVVIEMNNVSTDVNDYVVTDKKADDKKQYTFNTIKAGDLVDENGNLLPDNNLTPAEGVKGDVDGNGTLDLQDAQMVLKAALKIIPVSDIIINNVDVDGQEGITLTDAQMVLKAALKIIKL